MTFSTNQRIRSRDRRRPTIKGLRFPLTVENGNLATETDYDIIKQNIESVLRTHKGERVLRPKFGVRHIFFEAGTNSAIAAYTENLRVALTSQVPRIESVTVRSGMTDEGVLVVLIDYTAGGLTNPPNGDPIAIAPPV